MLRCCHPPKEIMKYRQEGIWAYRLPDIYVWMCNQHIYKHACTDTKDENELCSPPPPLPLCTYTQWLIALQPYGYQRDTTNLNFSHCLSALIHPVWPCKARGHGWGMLLLKVSIKTKVSLDVWKRREVRGLLCGISGLLQEREWCKGKEATNSFVSRGFWVSSSIECSTQRCRHSGVCVCVKCACRCVCVCGSQFKAEKRPNSSLVDESVSEWILVGSICSSVMM